MEKLLTQSFFMDIQKTQAVFLVHINIDRRESAGSFIFPFRFPAEYHGSSVKHYQRSLEPILTAALK